jgi:FMN phosphatase YigB (HAD superfamily)
MPKPRVILFDADGVLIRPPELFSHAYARRLGYPPDHFLPFFKGPFLKAILGQADLKDLIRQHNHLWHWSGDPTPLLQRWFNHENVRNEPLLAFIRKLRTAGTPCYIATNQEQYRAAYLRTVMFPHELDGIFVSCELGFQKPDPKYFETILNQLRHTYPDLQPAEVVFFDDSPAPPTAPRPPALMLMSTPI